ncbi:FimV-like protein [Neisseria sp. HSC-16F19]|nr:FimV/HubP family polar landmark protein [Neisseria sp. HSC-16F19]MCP2039723.1 FimV-like protein [Neisseria sp. HSC-16F19]
MKQHHSIKVIAASLLTAASLQAFAGLGSLSVHSALGEPFSGSIVVTGEEAKVLLNQKGSARVGGAPLNVSVRKQGNNAVVYLRSSQKINDPLLSFSLTVGQQGRQYTALLDPAEYRRAAPAPRGGSAVEKRAAPERDRKAQSRTEQRNKKAAAPAKSSGSNASVVFTGEQYTPQSGEHLIDIAQKFQPEGLSLRQTVNALVKANPRAFRNGNPDFMYRDVPLVIPTAEQLRQLAQPNADVRRIAQQSAGQQPAAESKPPVAPPAETPPAPQTPAETAPAPEAPPVAVPSAPEESVPPAASVPEMQASAEAPVVASEPETVPVAPPQTAPDTPVQPQVQAEEGNFFSELLGDNWYLYLGGAAALLLLLAGLALKRRQGGGGEEAAAAAPVLPAGGADEADEDDIVFESDVAAPATTAAPAVQAAPAAATAPAASQAEQDGDEWDWLADAAQQSQDKLGDTKLSASPSTAAVTTAGAAALGAGAVHAASAASSDEDWMSFAKEIDSPAAATVQVTGAEVASEAVEEEWVWVEEEDPAIAAMAEEAVPSANFAAEPDLANTLPAGDTAQFDWPESTDVVADTVPADDAAWLDGEEKVTQADLTAEADEALDWSVDSLDSGVSFETKATEPAADALQRQAFAASGEDLAVVDLDWDALEEADSVDTTVSVPEVQASEDVFAAADFDFEAPAVTEVPDFEQSQQAAADIPAFADTAAAPVAPTAAETVQLTVPMEAKLELAQMYLEIDDAQTARKTLQELVQEADGEVLAKARSLLQQLGE